MRDSIDEQRVIPVNVSDNMKTKVDDTLIEVEYPRATAPEAVLPQP
jgi:hypothetical protein